MRFSKRWSALLVLSMALASCEGEAPQVVDTFPYVGKAGGGMATVYDSYLVPFGQPIPLLTDEEQKKHDRGDVLFERRFVSSGNKVYAGLGPLFNESSCDACHPNDGRSAFPDRLNAPSGFFLRISQGNDPIYGPIAATHFGGQLQQNAVRGFQPEVRFAVSYTDKIVTYQDGTRVVLKQPHYSITSIENPLPTEYELSPRIGMPVFGLGLLELIPEEEILKHADPEDRDGDGVSGRPNYVWDHVKDKISLGRFGWKANTASLYEQCAAAMANDMGLTNPLFTLEERGDASLGRALEVSQQELEEVAFYCQTLAVPGRSNVNDPQVKLGERLFTELGCDVCHVPSMTTGTSNIASLDRQTIHAFTDMLLHDMGDDLADGRSDHLADGKEWKTRPLWGIGHTLRANGHENFLHDGRAKSIEEAILWHGGEAETAQKKYLELKKDDRDALMSFLRSL